MNDASNARVLPRIEHEPVLLVAECCEKPGFFFRLAQFLVKLLPSRRDYHDLDQQRAFTIDQERRMANLKSWGWIPGIR